MFPDGLNTGEWTLNFDLDLIRQSFMVKKSDGTLRRNKRSFEIERQVFAFTYVSGLGGGEVVDGLS